MKFNDRKKRTSSLVEMSKENLPKAVLFLAWPIIVEMLLQSSVGIADTAMVGRLSPASIAAVGLGNQIIMLLLTVFAAVRTGATVLVARLIGAGEFEEANDAARQALIITIIFGLAVALFGVIFPEVGYRLLGAEEEVILVGASYMRYRAIAALFACITMVVTGILQGCGDTLTAMKVNVTLNLLNIIFNYLLIFGRFGFPEMGTAGAGAATMIARMVGAAMMLAVLFRGKGDIRLRVKDGFKLSKDVLKRLLNVGIPAGIEQGLMRGAQLFFTMVVTNLGTVMYAAHQIVLRADSVAFMPGFGFATAATALVGQNLGAKQPKEAEKAAHITMLMAIGLMSFVGVFLFFFATPIMKFFTNDPEVIAAGISPMRIISFSMPFMAIERVSAGALRGAGDTKYVMFGTGISIWIARLGLAYVLVNYFDMGLVGAWIGMFADHIVRAAFFFTRFKKGQWKFIRL
jgi:putative MATE family efflux protein